jgi:hypothetical protein
MNEYPFPIINDSSIKVRHIVKVFYGCSKRYNTLEEVDDL